MVYEKPTAICERRFFQNEKGEVVIQLVPISGEENSVFTVQCNGILQGIDQDGHPIQHQILEDMIIEADSLETAFDGIPAAIEKFKKRLMAKMSGIQIPSSYKRF